MRGGPKPCEHGYASRRYCHICKATYSRKGYRKLRSKDPLRARFQSILVNMRRRKGVTVASADLVNLWHKQDGKCFYCGQVMDYKGGPRKDNTVSVDRIDNAQPYTITNIVLACWACNGGKSPMNREQFIAHCLRVVIYNAPDA